MDYNRSNLLNHPEMGNRNSRPSEIKSAFLFVLDFLKVIIIALAIILPIRYFVFQPFIVSGSSMEPNYVDGQYLIIDEISYRTRDPLRGEVVVLKFPKDRSQYFIKRVIGLPGEKIQIEDGKVVIYNKEHPNGTVLDESYLPSQGLSFPRDTSLIGGRKTITLSETEYFVMGDNRLASSDSRDWGALNRNDIVGKVYLRALPLSEFERFNTPEYSLN
jgi:signal peptidase I